MSNVNIRKSNLRILRYTGKPRHPICGLQLWQLYALWWPCVCIILEGRMTITDIPQIVHMIYLTNSKLANHNRNCIGKLETPVTSEKTPIAGMSSQCVGNTRFIWPLSFSVRHPEKDCKNSCASTVCLILVFQIVSQLYILFFTNTIYLPYICAPTVWRLLCFGSRISIVMFIIHIRSSVYKPTSSGTSRLNEIWKTHL